jgi:hypothetical protein
MKCPLRKDIRTLYQGGNIDQCHQMQYADGLREEFLDCIEGECAAWNKEEKLCNYLSGKRQIEIRM